MRKIRNTVAAVMAAVFVFLGALAVIVLFAAVPSLLPSWDGKALKMNIVIQIGTPRYHR